MPPSSEAWVVINSGAVSSSFKDLLRRAFQIGLGDKVVSAAKIIMQRLTNDPLVFGEPLYHLRRLGLEVRTGGEPPLMVTYGVHKDRHLVYVSSIRPSSESGI
jgi:hypothetical protein